MERGEGKRKKRKSAEGHWRTGEELFRLSLPRLPGNATLQARVSCPITVTQLNKEEADALCVIFGQRCSGFS